MDITIKQDVVQCALLCLKCDFSVADSTFIFIATGQITSAMALEVYNKIVIIQSNIQYRIRSNFSSGIVHTVNTNIDEFVIFSSQISGHTFQNNTLNGYIIASLNINININISNFSVCSQLQPVGLSSYLLNMNNVLSITCNICNGLYIVYGLCQHNLQFGQINNYTIECIKPFEFNGRDCVCEDGFELNVSICVNRIQLLTLLNLDMITTKLQLNQSIDIVQAHINNEIQRITYKYEQELLNQNIQQQQFTVKLINDTNNIISQNSQQLQQYVTKQINNTQQMIQDNISQITVILEKYIIQNITNVRNELVNSRNSIENSILLNVSQLENKIQNSYNQSIKLLKSNVSYLEQQINNSANNLQNTILDAIFKNSSILEARIISNASYLKTNITSSMQTLQNIIDSVKTQAYTNLTNTHAFINNTIAQNLQTQKDQIYNSIQSTKQVIENEIKQNSTSVLSKISQNYQNITTQIQTTENNQKAVQQQVLQLTTTTDSIGTIVCKQKGRNYYNGGCV
ncbi:Hypothetical_protein [Hexamita inflata]|uniref:Hypothetical_protein n=1 Tax=Hexamita inflata TaxID=28002 RepID=A0AA86NLF4_9EUKA|nr:Hypothetical protein HINF_LOCUS8945 [Hexamita inflata]